MHIAVVFVGILCFGLLALALPQMTGKQAGRVIFGFIGVVILLGLLASFGVPLIGLIIVVLVLKGVMSNSSKEKESARMERRAAWEERMEQKKEKASGPEVIDDNGPGI